MPDLYSDDNGNRVIVRNLGPAGKGFPVGGTTGQILVKSSNVDYEASWTNAPNGTGAAVGPASAVNGNFVLFDGTTGKLLKDAGQGMAYFATKAYADTKVTIEAGKGLSQENFTTALLTKLNGLSETGYRGSYANLAAIQAETFSPLQAAGDYCLIEVGSSAVQLVLWDETNTEWSILAADAVDMTGAAIAAVLFNVADVWSQSNCRIFTTTEKATLASHEALIQSLGLSGISPALTYVAVSATYIVPAGIKTVNCTANTFTVTLPTAVGQTSDITVKNSGGGTITVNTTGGIQTIDGATSVQLTTLNESVTFRSTNTNWIII